MKYKTFAERYKDDILSDNSKANYCSLCKDCKFRSDGTAWSNHHSKGHCMIYQYPNMKPSRVIDNKGLCEYYSKEDESSQD